MPGTKEGAAKARAAALAKNPNHFRDIAKLVKNEDRSKNSAFGRIPGLAESAGRKGGSVKKGNGKRHQKKTQETA